ncbi:MAG: conjugative transfer system coupling protein TraD [Methylicorpusculum sp.]|jgi:conjugal transfer pilus assembly protein TraD|uniref:conjugative transfer system coupling protein TraD n=1 Tax=Methylicorpusculum TaxID=2713642 RepID=UPI00135BB1A3|nr:MULTISPECIES: conjugative transfer system coupling protein TraD [Methylicorpusculum]MCD2451929.1 conjugative transfer system coupling protein TraD [Methylicorpusculum oleiharenae]MDP2202744.1 conjugative transfer system coupling protein TraD [Methylicorpusculum sp.]
MANNYDPYIRKPYELYIATAWFVATATSFAGYIVLPGGNSMMLPWLCFGFMALQSAIKGLDLVGRGKVGEMLTFMDVGKLLELVKPEKMWFGWGFDWMPIHTQRAVDYMLSGVKINHDQESPGSLWIHGLNLGKEKDVLIPLKSLEGHTIMFGTTGAGKTRAYEVMVTQAIHRGDTVIMIDPKGDKELRDRMELECARAGRDDSFLFFHPAFPKSSIRLDPMRNFTRTTEIASRIAALLPSQTGGSDAFTAFAFRALNLVAQGLLETGKRPSIKQLRYYIEGGAESLLVHAIEAHADRVEPNWKEGSAEPFFTKAKAGKAKKMETITNPDWLATIEWYRATMSNGPNGSEGIDGLLSLVEHNRLHFSKMIASLIPVLNMLTSGDLGELLSPNEDDTRDSRQIFDTSTIISGKHVLYVGLDSLSDSIVSSAIGSIVLADFASVAGMIYNSGKKPGRISMFVDEAAEVVNLPFIQILNKGRGAGFQVVMATQTLPDIVARLGDEARARQVVGNCNNLITLRIKDGDTQQFVVETFGQTYIKTVQQSISSAVNSAENIINYSGNSGQSLSFGEHDLFPQHLLGHLPNFHYIASIAGGRVIKGRLPIITH